MATDSISSFLYENLIVSGSFIELIQGKDDSKDNKWEEIEIPFAFSSL
jgi:hypothetical protein